MAVGGPPVLGGAGRAWASGATVDAGGPPVLVEPGRSRNYEANVAVGGPPVLVEPGRAWTYEAVVAAGGVLSGVFVVTANAWMNSPAGFFLDKGLPADVSPVAAMLNPAWRTEVFHMTLAAFAASASSIT